MQPVWLREFEQSQFNKMRAAVFRQRMFIESEGSPTFLVGTQKAGRIVMIRGQLFDSLKSTSMPPVDHGDDVSRQSRGVYVLHPETDNRYSQFEARTLPTH
jgi:hypothetical protein